jgi:tRNA threonylcarbamoyladenosine biosynthesis protein TsaB
MVILAIETTGMHASVAIIDERGQPVEETSDKKLSHLQNLIPMIDDLLDKCKLSIDDVTCIAVSQGPGSFTGIRIGMATGKALAQALGILTIGVPTLQSLCFNVPDFNGLVLPIFDARRNQVYAGAYYWEGGQVIKAMEDEAIGLSEYLKKVDNLRVKMGCPVLFMGDGIEPNLGELKEWAIETKRLLPNDDISRILADPAVRMQKASSVAKLALRIAIDGGANSFELMNPVYLRKAEAERKLKLNRKKDPEVNAK